MHHWYVHDNHQSPYYLIMVSSIARLSLSSSIEICARIGMPFLSGNQKQVIFKTQTLLLCRTAPGCPHVHIEHFLPLNFCKACEGIDIANPLIKIALFTCKTPISAMICQNTLSFIGALKWRIDTFGIFRFETL